MFLTLMFLGCGPKHTTPTAVDWFPMAEGSSWSYAATFNGNSYSETRVSLPVRLSDGEEAWVFVELDQVGSDIASVFTGSFGLGAYRRGAAGLETADAYYLEDVSALASGDFQPMLTLPPRSGERIDWDTSSVDRGGGIKVEGYESVTVPAGTFEGCVKLSLGQESYAWLAPDVGLVRWVLVTGRVEELESFTLRQ